MAVATQLALSEITDPTTFDPSSRIRVAQVGDTIILRNRSDHFAYAQVKEVIPRNQTTGQASVKLTYLIPQSL